MSSSGNQTTAKTIARLAAGSQRSNQIIFYLSNGAAKKQYKHFANHADPLTHVVVFFIPDDVFTQVYLLHSGWRSTPEWKQARQWQARAWEGAFQELERLVNQGRDRGKP